MADLNVNVIGNNNIKANDKKNIICGVVEGFYGRPWTTEQRKDLFVKLQKWEMNCYLYAPKDDYKHRSFWRELYTVEEAEHLTALITEAHAHNIDFYYAVSPGLDITYSSQKEVSALKRKLEQVQQLGCNAFAILFDDIDPEMSGADKEIFQSFAYAQVSITNEIFTHLNQPKFMFCPTQYCSARALPSVTTSEYLTTLGSKLAPEIDIMWTGPKVISKVLSLEHIREVTEVCKRPPIIWDNLHANDYDQARLFLGPYCGRSPELIKLVRGVVTNPNCEYGPNFIAIHTLAQWSRSSISTNCDNEAVSADIRLETEGDDAIDDCPSGLSPNAYHPRRALRLALLEWLPEFDRMIQFYGPVCQPQIPTPGVILPSVNTCMSITSTTVAPSATVLNNVTVGQNTPNIPANITDSTFSPVTNPVMNSLVSESKVIIAEPSSVESDSTISKDTNSSGSVEPMDCNPSPESCQTSEDPMLVESKDDSISATIFPTSLEETSNSSPELPSITEDKKLYITPNTADQSDDKCSIEDKLSIDDLQLITDLFYLPYEHGKFGLQILNEFNWLKVNSHLIIEHNKSNVTPKPEVEEWFSRASKFSDLSTLVKRMSNRLLKIKNRSLLYDLHPYVWDMRGVIALLNSYIEWLALGKVSPLVSNYVHGNYTWSSKGWRDVFMSGDQEPWVFRGGLTAELQRLIPIDASNDLFVYKTPIVPIVNNFIIRPYLDGDRSKLYNVALLTGDDGSDASELFRSHPDLKGDLAIGNQLERITDCIFMVVEDDAADLVGYCVAEGNIANRLEQYSVYLETLRTKYPKVTVEEEGMRSPCEELLSSLYDEPIPTPENVTITYPAYMSISIINSLSDESVNKRLVTCVIASLRAQGIFGGHMVVKKGEKNLFDFYSRLGFREVETIQTSIYLGRSF